MWSNQPTPVHEATMRWSTVDIPFTYLWVGALGMYASPEITMAATTLAEPHESGTQQVLHLYTSHTCQMLLIN